MYTSFREVSLVYRQIRVHAWPWCKSQTNFNKRALVFAADELVFEMFWLSTEKNAQNSNDNVTEDRKHHAVSWSFFVVVVWIRLGTSVQGRNYFHIFGILHNSNVHGHTLYLLLFLSSLWRPLHHSSVPGFARHAMYFWILDSYQLHNLGVLYNLPIVSVKYKC